MLLIRVTKIRAFSNYLKKKNYSKSFKLEFNSLLPFSKKNLERN